VTFPLYTRLHNSSDASRDVLAIYRLKMEKYLKKDIHFLKSVEPFLLVSPLKSYFGRRFSLLKSTFDRVEVLILHFRLCSARLIAQAISTSHFAYSCEGDTRDISLIGMFAGVGNFSEFFTLLKCNSAQCSSHVVDLAFSYV